MAAQSPLVKRLVQIPICRGLTETEAAEVFAICEEIGQIEGRADDSFDHGLTKLRAQVRDHEIDTLAYLDRKELYELVENVVDKCDDIANAVQSITAKHV